MKFKNLLKFKFFEKSQESVFATPVLEIEKYFENCKFMHSDNEKMVQFTGVAVPVFFFFLTSHMSDEKSLSTK